MIKRLFTYLSILAMALGSTPIAMAQDSNASTVKEFEVEGVKFFMVLVPAGKFMMTQAYMADLDSYYIGQTEVTQELWTAVMQKNPSKPEGEKLPVVNVSFKDCQKFIKKLNELTGLNFRLPTEAEWTYAAIGGKNSHGYAFSGSNKLAEVAWTESTADVQVDKYEKVKGKASKPKLHEVGTKSPNELGIYDMTGNVNEWCADWYEEEFPVNQVIKNPVGPKNGAVKVFKGGGYKSSDETSAIAYRSCDITSTRNDDIGLRLVLVP